jgi:hypothetical protein
MLPRARHREVAAPPRAHRRLKLATPRSPPELIAPPNRRLTTTATSHGHCRPSRTARTVDRRCPRGSAVTCHVSLSWSGMQVLHCALADLRSLGSLVPSFYCLLSSFFSVFSLFDLVFYCLFSFFISFFSHLLFFSFFTLVLYMFFSCYFISNLS